VAFHKATHMLHPYGTRETCNLDSLRTMRPTIGSGGRWRNFTTITSATHPKFDQTWLRLSDSGRLERYLSMDGSEMSYLPVGEDRVVPRTCHSGAIVLVERDGDSGVWTILVPRNDPFADLADDGDVVDALDPTHSMGASDAA
jgi:hypothetical protein